MASPEISIEQHRRTRVHELGRGLMSRKAIYLDLRFWIRLRDAARYDKSGPEKDLLSALRSAVASGKAFCPITDSTFLEMFKQTDPESRLATADLIDELSLGVTLIPFDMRIGTEIAHHMHSTRAPDMVDPLRELVWSKLHYVMGFTDPVLPAYDQQTNLAIQKAFFDDMWDSATLLQMTQVLGEQFVDADPLHFGETAARLNEEILRHSDNVKSMQMTYRHELIGVLDLYVSLVASIVAHSLPPEAEPLPAEGTAERAEVDQQCLALLLEAFDTEAGRLALRTLHINTTLYAAHRWDTGQSLKANDLFDFHHACAAIAYCDAFFTEKPLRTLVCRSDIRLDKQFGCFVTSDFTESIAYVESLSGNDC